MKLLLTITTTLIFLFAFSRISAQTFFGDLKPVVGNCESDNPVELGLKFTVAETGRITALRFYKCTIGTSPYTLKLYAGNAQVSVNHSSNVIGWIEVPIAPINVTTGVTYVVSYFTSGNYHSSVNNSYPIIVGSLRASGSVYRYGGSGQTPPSQVYLTSNYYADVRFVKSGAPIPCDTVYKRDTLYLPTHYPDSSVIKWQSPSGDSTVVYFYFRDTVALDTIFVPVDTLHYYDTITHYDTTQYLIGSGALDTINYPWWEYKYYKLREFTTIPGKPGMKVERVRYRHYLMEAIKQEVWDEATQTWKEVQGGN